MLGAALGGGTLALLGAWRWWDVRQPLPFAAGDWLLIADLDNRTGDPLLDLAPQAGFEVALAQSRHLNLVPTRRLLGALRRQGRPVEVPLTAPLALELAQREGIGWVAASRIERHGDGLRIESSLFDARTGQSLRSLSAEARTREQLPQAMNELALALRRALAEPEAEIAARSVPLALATTASLEALDRYARSQRAMRVDEAKAVAPLREAIALDADFALALGKLAVLQLERGTRESRREGDTLMERALALPQRLTSRDRLWLHAAADDRLGNREAAVAGYKAFLAQHPLDTTGWFRLGWLQMAALRRYEDAMASFGRVTAIDANDVGAWINLATCQGSLGRREEALATYQKAFAIDPTQRLLPFVNGEHGALLVRLGRVDEARASFEEMARQADAQRAARGLRLLAFLAMHEGRYREAIGQLERAIVINDKAGLGISALRDRLLVATAQLALGNRAQARATLAAADAAVDALSPANEWLAKLVRLHAQLGELPAAERLVARMAAAVGVVAATGSVAHNASNDLRNLDLARGELAMARGRSEEAVAHMNAAAVDMSAWLVRGPQARALHAAGRLDAAAETYRQLIASAPFGVEPQEDAAGAVVALAGIYETQGRRGEAKALYEELVRRWKDGDPELLLLQQARARLKRLG